MYPVQIYAFAALRIRLFHFSCLVFFGGRSNSLVLIVKKRFGEKINFEKKKREPKNNNQLCKKRTCTAKYVMRHS